MPFLKKACIVLLLPFATLLLALSLALIFLPKQPNINQPPTSYVLKDCGGYPALYKSTSTLPFRTYPNILTNLLPFADMVNLKNGIPVYSERELAKIITYFNAS